MAAPKGHPRYGGRVKGVLNKRTLLLAAILDEVAQKTKFDWVTEFINDFKTGNDRRKDYWSIALPFLVAKPTITPVEKEESPPSPEESAQDALYAQRLLDEIEQSNRA
jgi:hypothetical protein